MSGMSGIPNMMPLGSSPMMPAPVPSIASAVGSSPISNLFLPGAMPYGMPGMATNLPLMSGNFAAPPPTMLPTITGGPPMSQASTGYGLGGYNSAAGYGGTQGLPGIQSNLALSGGGNGSMAPGPLPPQGPQYGNYGGPQAGVYSSGGLADTFGAAGNPAGMTAGPSVAQARALMGLSGPIGNPGLGFFAPGMLGGMAPGAALPHPQPMFGLQRG